MAKIKELKDFRYTPYYKYYNKTIDEYCIQIIESTMIEQWTDQDKKYTRSDVLKEVYKFVNRELRDFKDKIEINPSTEEVNYEEEKRMIREQAKQLLGMN